MTKKFIFTLSIVLLTWLYAFPQAEPEVTLTILANEKIADVNIDQDKYIKSMGALLELMKKQFKGIPGDQKVAILMVTHKVEKPTIEIYSKPKIDAAKEQAVLKEIGTLNFEHTKLVDFPVLLSINVKEGIPPNELNDFVPPADKIKAEYKNADLKQKYELNKIWASTEVLPVFAAYQTMVEDKFEGVKNFGKLGAKTNFSTQQNITVLTSNNSDYWRANMEMGVGNELIPATKIFMLVSQGTFDLAIEYWKIVKMVSDPGSVADFYLKELTWRFQLFVEQLNAEIEKGIKEHDKNKYEKAITVYNSVLSNYPNSAWALYERYYSQNALDVKNGKSTMEDRTNWDNAKIEIFKANPLYYMDVRASNAKEGYLLFRRQGIAELFKSKENRIKDIYKYADIAMDLGIYDFAAQLFWYSFVYSKGEDNKALMRFLYCIEKCGVTNLKQNFKGDFKKEFEQIDKEKEDEMKNDTIYKSFKN